MAKTLPKRPLAWLISTVWPEPSSSAAGTRTLQLLRSLSHIGFDIALSSPSSQSPRSASIDEVKMIVSQGEGNLIEHCSVRANDPDFDELAIRIQPAVVVFDRFIMEEQFGWRVAEKCPNAIRVVDSQDLHFLRHYRSELAKQQRDQDSLGSCLLPVGSSDMNAALQTETARREIASFLRSDVTLVISSEEHQLLASSCAAVAKQLLYFPFVYSDVELPRLSTESDFSRRQPAMVMIGNFKHPPNADAVRRVVHCYSQTGFKKSLTMPLVDIFGPYAGPEFAYLISQSNCSSSNSTFTTVGSDDEGEHKSNRKVIEGIKRVRLRGPCVNAVSTISQYRVLFAPLRFGAGLKGKLFDAIMAGTPFVSSTIGVEGILCQNSLSSDVTSDEIESDMSAEVRKISSRMIQLCVSDDMKDAIALANHLICNEADWNEVVQLGKRLLVIRFSKARFENQLAIRLFLKNCRDACGDGVHASLASNGWPTVDLAKLSNERMSADRLLQRVLTDDTVHRTKMLSRYIEMKHKFLDADKLNKPCS